MLKGQVKIKITEDNAVNILRHYGVLIEVSSYLFLGVNEEVLPYDMDELKKLLLREILIYGKQRDYEMFIVLLNAYCYMTSHVSKLKL